MSARLKNVEREEFSDFLSELPLFEASFAHWRKVGEIRAGLSAKGFHVSTPEAHVAQCAIDLDGYLVSEDLMFGKIAGHAGLKMLPL